MNPVAFIYRPCSRIVTTALAIIMTSASLLALAEPASFSTGAEAAAVAPDWEKYATPKADKIVVYKAERKMELWHGDLLLRTYHVSLGRHPQGQKVASGDGRTPEGHYTIDRRKMNSEYHLALHISYPSQKDLRTAAALGVEPGGSIMIHGQPVYLNAAQRKLLKPDWTAGCIALTNPEIDEVWRLTDNGTEIDINP